MTDPASVTEQSTITIGLLIGSIGTLIMATRAFVNLARDVTQIRQEMVSRAEFREALLRLAKDNPTMRVHSVEDHAA